MNPFREKLNQELLVRQKVTDAQIDELEKIYDELVLLVNTVNKLKKISPEEGSAFAKQMEDIEFKLQDNWNFPRSELHHTWWNRFNKCTCPKMDNYERFGFKKIKSLDCPFHGN